MDVVATATQPLELTLQRSATTAMNRFVKESYDADHGLGSGGWAALLRKWRHPFSPVQMAVLRALHQWRDTCAREEDESTRYVLPNHMLYALADRMPTEPAALLAACQPTPPLLRLYASDVARLVVQAKTRAEERMAEFRGVIDDVHSEVRPMAPVHTRFNEPMDAADNEEPATDVADVLTPELMSAAAVLMSPGAALFGRLDARPQQESEAMRRAREIRSNLVLTVVMPSAVLTGAEDMEVDAPVVPVAAKRPHAAITAAAPANQPVVLSETYAKYQPEQAPKHPKRQKTSDLDNLPTISLGDISSSSSEDEATAAAAAKSKKSRSKSKRIQAGGSKVATNDITPHEYAAADPEEDVLGESARPKKKKNRKPKRSAQEAYDPYAQITTTKELAKRPARSRVNNKEGNRSMTFKN
ncbi:exosome nuclease subunit [Kickxella alabastrina]|nr:exosome nuclease subunit [Kickxella alabastrina]